MPFIYFPLKSLKTLAVQLFKFNFHAQFLPEDGFIYLGIAKVACLFCFEI